MVCCVFHIHACNFLFSGSMYLTVLCWRKEDCTFSLHFLCGNEKDIHYTLNINALIHKHTESIRNIKSRYSPLVFLCFFFLHKHGLQGCYYLLLVVKYLNSSICLCFCEVCRRKFIKHLLVYKSEQMCYISACGYVYCRQKECKMRNAEYTIMKYMHCRVNCKVVFILHCNIYRVSAALWCNLYFLYWDYSYQYRKIKCLLVCLFVYLFIWLNREKTGAKAASRYALCKCP